VTIRGTTQEAAAASIVAAGKTSRNQIGLVASFAERWRGCFGGSEVAGDSCRD